MLERSDVFTNSLELETIGINEDFLSSLTPENINNMNLREQSDRVIYAINNKIDLSAVKDLIASAVQKIINKVKMPQKKYDPLQQILVIEWIILAQHYSTKEELAADLEYHYVSIGNVFKKTALRIYDFFRIENLFGKFASLPEEYRWNDADFYKTIAILTQKLQQGRRIIEQNMVTSQEIPIEYLNILQAMKNCPRDRNQLPLFIKNMIALSAETIVLNCKTKTQEQPWKKNKIIGELLIIEWFILAQHYKTKPAIAKILGVKEGFVLHKFSVIIGFKFSDLLKPDFFDGKSKNFYKKTVLKFSGQNAHASISDRSGLPKDDISQHSNADNTINHLSDEIPNGGMQLEQTEEVCDGPSEIDFFEDFFLDRYEDADPEGQTISENISEFPQTFFSSSKRGNETVNSFSKRKKLSEVLEVPEELQQVSQVLEEPQTLELIDPSAIDLVLTMPDEEYDPDFLENFFGNMRK